MNVTSKAHTVRKKWNKNFALITLLLFLLFIFNFVEIDIEIGDDTSWSSGPNGGSSNTIGRRSRPSSQSKELETVQLMTVSCGKPNYQGIRDVRKPLDQSLTMIKSAALFCQKKLHIHIFTEEDMKPLFKEEIDSWPKNVLKRVKYTLHDAEYQEIPEELKNQWKGWYKPCGSFRLLTPHILPKFDVQAAIYSDSDVIWTRPIDQLWDELSEFEENQVMGVSPTAGHPLGGSRLNENFIMHNTGLFQINTGVMLMNFTKINQADWFLPHDEVKRERPGEPVKWGSDLLIPYYQKYKDKAEHDQKLMNIVFHYNPHLLRQLNCHWNFKTNFCMDENNICQSAEDQGPGAVHGITSAFFGHEHPTFKALYETFKAYEWDRNLNDALVGVFEDVVERTAKHTFCGRKSSFIGKVLRESCGVARL